MVFFIDDISFPVIKILFDTEYIISYFFFEYKGFFVDFH